MSFSIFLMSGVIASMESAFEVMRSEFALISAVFSLIRVSISFSREVFAEVATYKDCLSSKDSLLGVAFSACSVSISVYSSPLIFSFSSSI